ncbi:MAG: hypothetical protein HY059_07550 [Proteobacteria bacterium]|nr:hypothetical protein [Pseudomonadota bacterium]
MRNLTLSLKSVVESRAEVADELKLPGDAVLIHRGQPRWLLLKCPCGCGDEIPVNLDRRAGKAWRLYRDARSVVTVFPSVWRDTGCESHFIIWRDQILMFGGDDDTNLSSSPVHPDLRDLAERVLGAWPAAEWRSYADVADALGEIPWDVLDACRYLAQRDLLIEGRGQRRGTFQRR